MLRFLEKLLPTIGRKINAAVMLTLLAGGSVFVFFAYRTGSALLKRQAHVQAHAIIEFGLAATETAMSGNNQNHLETAFKLPPLMKSVREVMFLRKNGMITFSTEKKSVSSKISIDKFHPLPEWPDALFLSYEENDSLFEYSIVPVLKKESCYRCHKEPESRMGYFGVKISMDDLQAASLKHRTSNIIVTFIILFGIGGVIVLSLFLLVIKPVTALRRQIINVEHQFENIKQGKNIELTLLKRSRSNDEISKLIEAFNKLIWRLNDAHNQLFEIHQSQLEQADRLSTAGEIAASIAHEIKNPLAGVLGAIQVLKAEISDNHPNKAIMQEMISQLERMNFAVNDLLSYARPAPPVFEEINVNDIIERTLSLIIPQITDKGISIQRNLDDKLPLIKADKNLLQQLIWNISLNAVQAMKSGGDLIVASTKRNSYIVITIQDDGEGIPEAIRSDIFKPFFSTKHKGTGLGLAICKRIIEQHKGAIHLQSKGDKGTIVTISLPIKEESD